MPRLKCAELLSPNGRRLPRSRSGRRRRKSSNCASNNDFSFDDNDQNNIFDFKLSTDEATMKEKGERSMGVSQPLSSSLSSMSTILTNHQLDQKKSKSGLNITCEDQMNMKHSDKSNNGKNVNYNHHNGLTTTGPHTLTAATHNKIRANSEIEKIKSSIRYHEQQLEIYRKKLKQQTSGKEDETVHMDVTMENTTQKKQPQQDEATEKGYKVQKRPMTLLAKKMLLESVRKKYGLVVVDLKHLPTFSLPTSQQSNDPHNNNRTCSSFSKSSHSSSIQKKRKEKNVCDVSDNDYYPTATTAADTCSPYCTPSPAGCPLEKVPVVRASKTKKKRKENEVQQQLHKEEEDEAISTVTFIGRYVMHLNEVSPYNAEFSDMLLNNKDSILDNDAKDLGKTSDNEPEFSDFPLNRVDQAQNERLCQNFEDKVVVTPMATKMRTGEDDVVKLVHDSIIGCYVTNLEEVPPYVPDIQNHNQSTKVVATPVTPANSDKKDGKDEDNKELVVETIHDSVKGSFAMDLEEVLPYTPSFSNLSLNKKDIDLIKKIPSKDAIMPATLKTTRKDVLVEDNHNSDSQPSCLENNMSGMCSSSKSSVITPQTQALNVTQQNHYKTNSFHLGPPKKKQRTSYIEILSSDSEDDLIFGFS